MIAMGGVIGTGLFLALGASIFRAGPGGALAAYALMGLVVYFLMQSLAEMSSFMPVSGSFAAYASRFTHPAFGAVLGWDYWLNWAITCAVELNAVVILVQYWSGPLAPPAHALVMILALAFLFFLNYLRVRNYGRSEFILSALKIAAALFALIFGIFQIRGFASWTLPGAAFPRGLRGVWAVFLIAGFSCQGTELIGVGAGEAREPGRSMPLAARSSLRWSLILYLGSILIIGTLIPASELNADGSPFTLILERAGLAFAPSLLNAVILIAVVSCGNSGLYAASRMFYSLAEEGLAPRSFAKLDRRGVPLRALILVTLSAALVAVIGFFFGTKRAFLRLLDISSVTGFIAWLGIAVSHLAFRRWLRREGKSLAELPFRAKWYPLGPIVSAAVCLIVIAAQFF
jgi:lysine-specific permease